MGTTGVEYYAGLAVAPGTSGLTDAAKFTAQMSRLHTALNNAGQPGGQPRGLPGRMTGRAKSVTQQEQDSMTVPPNTLQTGHPGSAHGAAPPFGLA